MEATGTPESFLQKNWQKLIAVGFWVALIGTAAWYYQSNNLTPLEAVQQIVTLLSSPIGAVIYILVYMVRPLVFFPATVLTIAGGSIFGAFWGIVWTIIGSNLSATIAYLLGRFLGKGLIETEQDSNAEGFVQKWTGRLRRNAFESVLTMRLLFLPYDLVNYLSGFLKVDYKAFILATAIGSIAGTISFVLFGAAIDIRSLTEDSIPGLNPVTLVISVVLFVVSLGFSRWLKRREAQRSEQQGS
ncbi:MAG: TVP38/TMEM64 family protein [Chloroflexaceae bacterium]|nr:TVP38/TMEM64 family protein [Chloroflexaceae bacterium]NJL34965.1 TVP38/TMEM64 family protein [Chloroflexaceae bacterium]NJO05892.1 TVP38/TMEM64 family protein [Chloroflexaceae bacterium]